MNKFYSFCYKFILIIGLVLLMLLGITNIFVYGHVHSTGDERMVFYHNGVVIFVLLALFAFSIWKLKDVIGKFPTKKIFLICSVIYLIIGFYIVFRVTDGLRGDPYMIYKYAQKFLEKDYEGLTAHYYLRLFPYQLGMVTYEMGLLSIWRSTRIFFIANLIFVLGINFIQWKITELLFDDNRVTNCCILLSFGFIPLLLYILFVYGSIPGHFFVYLGLYNLIKYVKQNHFMPIVFCALCFGISIIFKPNYIIAIAAGLIVLFLEFIQKPDFKRVLIIIMVAILSIGINKAFLQMWRNISGVNFDGGAPFILNVTMGLQPEEMGSGRLGGWYNGYNFDTFTENNFDVDAAHEIAINDLKELVNYWTSGDDDALEFFRTKLLSTWCDPLFQSIWSGPIEDLGQVVNDKVLHSLYANGHAAMAAEKYMNLFMVIVYLLAGIWCFREFKKKAYSTATLFCLLWFIGGLLFHLISETKSQYVYMYAYGLIPYAASALFAKKE